MTLLLAALLSAAGHLGRHGKGIQGQQTEALDPHPAQWARAGTWPSVHNLSSSFTRPRAPP